MTYTAAKPPLPHTSDELRARIPGWGVDLDPRDRPSVPRERLDPSLNGAHWDFPDRQPEKVPRERSVEHKFLTPVFGTSCPTKGVSGSIRRYAYKNYSEARIRHWALLIVGDRVESLGSSLRSYPTLRPDKPATGVLTELSHHGLSSRLGKKRADVKHQALDPIVVLTPWAVKAGAAFLVIRAIARRRRG